MLDFNERNSLTFDAANLSRQRVSGWRYPPRPGALPALSILIIPLRATIRVMRDFASRWRHPRHVRSGPMTPPWHFPLYLAVRSPALRLPAMSPALLRFLRPRPLSTPHSRPRPLPPALSPQPRPS